MCGDAVLGVLVHFVGADLNLDRTPTGTNHRRMQRLIEVELRHGDIVFETPGNRVPPAVKRSQYRIAVANCLDQYAHGDKIKDLIKGFITDDHLLIDRIVVFRPPTHGSLSSRSAQILFNLRDHFA